MFTGDFVIGDVEMGGAAVALPGEGLFGNAQFFSADVAGYGAFFDFGSGGGA